LKKQEVYKNEKLMKLQVDDIPLGKMAHGKIAN
jgi:hypothetical protein